MNVFFYMYKTTLRLSLKKSILEFHACRVKHHLRYTLQESVKKVQIIAIKIEKPNMPIPKFYPAETMRFHNISAPVKVGEIMAFYAMRKCNTIFIMKP